MSLHLDAQRDGEGERPPMPPVPLGVPATLEDTGRVLNDGILVGEEFGVDSKRTIETVNAVERALEDEEGEDVPRLFVQDDYPVLLDFYGRVIELLDQALDSAGNPRGALGAKLAGSQHVEQSPNGLVLRSRRRSMVELREALRDLFRMLEFAQRHHLVVRMEIV